MKCFQSLCLPFYKRTVTWFINDQAFMCLFEIGKILHEGGARSNLGVVGILMGITAVEDEIFQMTDLIKLNVGHRPSDVVS